MSDNQNLSWEQLVEQIRQLGIDPKSDLGDLPPQVYEMLQQYQKSNGFAFADPADLGGIWNRVNEAISTNAMKKITADGVVTPKEQAVLDGSKDGKVSAKDSQTLDLPDTPRWVLQAIQQNGGVGDPTSQEKNRIVDEWNAVFGTKFTWDQLIQQPSFNDPTDTAQKVVGGALLDIEPIVSYKVTLPGMRSVDISADQQKTQFQAFGYDNKQIARIVRWADAYNLTDSTGHTAWQPLAALLKAKGIDAGLGYTDPTAQFIDPETGKVRHNAGLGAGARGRTPEDRAASASKASDVRGAANQLSVAFVTQAFKQNLNRYGDPTVAYLATMDQGLADRLLMSGGDSTKVSDKDALLAEQLMLNGQWTPDVQRGLGYASGSGLDAFMQRLNQRNSAGASGRIRVRPDETAVRQSVKDFWRQMFRQDPSEGLVDKMSGELIAAVMAAPDDQQVDVEARLRQMAEQSPQYQDLYGKKQPGQTEADYQAQFLAAAADIQGGQAPDEGAILSGMRTGQYQTTIGATAASALAQQNSKFLGRLATAAQIVNERT